MRRRPLKVVNPVGQPRNIDAKRRERARPQQYGESFRVDTKSGRLEINLETIPAFIELKAELATMRKLLLEMNT